MRCEKCQGYGFVSILPTDEEYPQRVPMVPGPCPRCGGSGIDHCCSGDVANAAVEGDDG